MSKTISTGFITDKINGIQINTSKKAHSSNYDAYSKRTVTNIIIHYTGNEKDTAWANANYFQTANRDASAHFFVDDNNIYQAVALKNVAWHCGGYVYYHSSARNSNSIGIEMCCTAGNYKVSAKTIKNTAYLTANLCKRLGIKSSQVDTYVLRHWDITHKSCPAQMSNGGKNDADWIAFKKQVKNILAASETQKATIKTVNYKVKVTVSHLNIRKGPGTNYADIGDIKDKGIYTIVREQKNGSNTWGRLKAGPVKDSSWICLTGYTKKV